ncbi:MAG TPA: ABATE domain-containing protein [Candidatus Acidoferrales bacterium]|nr:ABATE domain-containing protein [Candidatus Acidoferrales bacterium]
MQNNCIMASQEVIQESTAARPSPFFIAGSAGLDFLNSLATPLNEPVDWLASGGDLLNWLQSAGLLEPDTAAAVREAALPGEIDGVAAQARSLREWFRSFVRDHRGKALDDAALVELEPLNQLLSRDHEFSRIVRKGTESAGGLPLRRVRMRSWSSPETLLQPIAAALADLVCDENFAYVKACEGSRCTLFYVDRTRVHGRRWCSMSVCGNRSKQKARRRSRKDAALAS